MFSEPKLAAIARLDQETIAAFLKGSRPQA
jgi:hypothetical protein